jgi:RNA polymerase primary sigma factor
MSRVMTVEEEREKFEYFRDYLVRRVWELITTCDAHWEQFQYIVPDQARDLPYKQMAADSGGRIRNIIEAEFLRLHPDALDCEDGCSAGLFHLIHELRRIKAELVWRNMGLAYTVAFRYMAAGAKIGLEQGDILQHAHMGLCEGVERFRPEFGHRFSTYGTWWIKHAVTRAITNGALVRLPVHQHTKGKRPGAVVSLNAKLDPESEDSRTFLDLLEDAGPSVQEQLALRDDVLTAMRAVEGLNARDQQIIRMRFGIAPYKEPHTLSEIGEAFGLSRERIRQIEVKVLMRLRCRMRLAS